MHLPARAGDPRRRPTAGGATPGSEQPGHEEALAARPFVGPAGRLLDKPNRMEIAVRAMLE